MEPQDDSPRLGMSLPDPNLFESSAQLTDPEEDETVRMQRALSRILRNPELRDLRNALGALPANMPPEEIRQLAALIDAFIRNRPNRP
jgi:hypothetical protein